ncbi:Pyrroline-5-carboxylate reductase [Paraburkholderia caffeinitolerans]|uniref:Pyrroline-5-carboxylate reductase n=1 Tax=Paraburkholderia caffeinitolerans TaxID=1723730 RepID=A0A6J5GVU7_9BURK|nr:pyrroline-5-carboxylate reductase [Paraburkholderia caffeinitolerans]CAB3806374.1 Pyrroline-5-carboxylate reductase [Paraburkholderia caffeinitolerans]
MRIGFVGTGVITRAVVTGLVRSQLSFESIALSPRNAAVAAELATLDARIRVCVSNQEVLDTSDVICVAVVPQIVEDVLRALRFEVRHHVITFVPGTSIEKLHRLARPAATLARAIPLPAVADRSGGTAIFPPDNIARSIFSALGEAIEVTSENQFDALHAVTATTASFYAVLEAQAVWLTKQGLSYDAARTFLSGYSVGLALETTRTPQSFTEMIDYLMTPGGLNEQLHAELSSAGAYDHYGRALDRVLARVQG